MTELRLVTNTGKYRVTLKPAFGLRYVMRNENGRITLVVDPNRTPTLTFEEATALVSELTEKGHPGGKLVEVK